MKIKPEEFVKEMQKALNEQNVYEVLNILFDMPYEKVRNIYTYVLDNIN